MLSRESTGLASDGSEPSDALRRRQVNFFQENGIARKGAEAQRRNSGEKLEQGLTGSKPSDAWQSPSGKSVKQANPGSK